MPAKKSILLFLMFITLGLSSFPFENTEISVLTCAPGSQVYSVFGHSAIRVVDNENDIDIVYNFGTFDFSTPNFIFKFIRKTLLYSLSVVDTDIFIDEYTYENRSVIEQKLNLSEIQKEQVIEKLEFLYRPENRYYLYAFLEKNCTTEIRELLDEVGIIFPVRKLDVSNRDLIMQYVDHNPWLKFGINLLLGRSVDRKTDSYQSMFLPDYLYNELNHTYNEGHLLVKSEEILNSIDYRQNEKSSFWISPLFIFCLLFILVFIWNSKVIDITITLLIGITGIILFIVSITTSHIELKTNFNLLWCNPLYLMFIPLILKDKVFRWVCYVLILSILTTAIIWITGFQKFDYAIIPLLLILTIINIKPLRRNSFRATLH